jgi:hypothetical protein
MKDWDWYSGKDLKFNQSKPVKPRLNGKNTSQEVRKYADLLEKYEKECVEYQDDYKKYLDQFAERYSAFPVDLFKEAACAWMNKDVFDVVYDAAYDHSHSGGFEEVYNEFWNRVDFVERVMQVMK